MFHLICAWTNGWVNNRDAGDLRRHCAYYDVIVMILSQTISPQNDMSFHLWAWWRPLWRNTQLWCALCWHAEQPVEQIFDPPVISDTQRSFDVTGKLWSPQCRHHIGLTKHKGIGRMISWFSWYNSDIIDLISMLINHLTATFLVNLIEIMQIVTALFWAVTVLTS